MTIISLYSTSEDIDQNWHHLCSSLAEEKDLNLSIDSQIIVIGSIEREICMKIFGNLSEFNSQLLCARNFLSQ